MIQTLNSYYINVKKQLLAKCFLSYTSRSEDNLHIFEDVEMKTSYGDKHIKAYISLTFGEVNV